MNYQPHEQMVAHGRARFSEQQDKLSKIIIVWIGGTICKQCQRMEYSYTNPYYARIVLCENYTFENINCNIK